MRAALADLKLPASPLLESLGYDDDDDYDYDYGYSSASGGYDV